MCIRDRPYGNKPLHFGHIGGVFVPADAFARDVYKRQEYMRPAFRKADIKVMLVTLP